MQPFELLKVPYFLLDKEWQEDGVEHSRISYMIRSDGSYEEHLKFYQEQRDKLEDEHEETYTRWVFTAAKYKDIGGYMRHVTVFHFRVRDAG